MTDSGGPQRHTLRFLSTLLSQKVPEKSDTVLRCIISGQPKPEVTWYKNGQVMDECGMASSYEFFGNQYIHLLHIPRCTPSDAAVYQISAKNSSGMICCSASVDVECSSENPHLSPDLQDDRDTGWRRESGTCEEECANRIEEKGPLSKEEESILPATPTAADSSPSKFSHLRSLASHDLGVSSFENLWDVKGSRQTEEANDPNKPKEAADGSLFLSSSDTLEKQASCCHRTVHSQVSRLTNGGLHSDGLNDQVANSGHQYSKAQKYISLSLPLSEGAAGPGDRATVSKPLSPQASSEDSDSDYELCPEITLTCTEEFSEDDLEYLECSDVLTDYSNAVWQRNLQGTEHVFLLESDDEETEFGESGLGGCEHFLSEMGCGPWVSGDTGPRDATAGLCGYHSQSPQVGPRSGGASGHSPSSSQTGMTLTLGPHQDGTSTVTEQGRYKLPTASEAAENDYPGIQGETRDSHQAGEEFASDNLLNMEKAATETQRKPLAGELEKPGMNQCSETLNEKRAGETDLGSRRGSQRPGRGRRPGMKGKPKKAITSLQEHATEGALNPLHPAEPAQCPLTQSDKRETSQATAEATAQDSHSPAGECAIPTQAGEDTMLLQTPTDSLPRRGDANVHGDAGMQVDSLFETSQAPDHSDHPQVQIQETTRERISRSQTPAFSEPAGKEAPFPGTTTNSSPRVAGIQEASILAQHLEVESGTQDPPREEEDRESSTLGCRWEALEPVPETTDDNVFSEELSVHTLQETRADHREPEALSVACPDPTDTALPLGNACNGPKDREAACVLRYLDQGTCCEAMESPVVVPVGKYLSQEFCSTDMELVGQDRVTDLCPPADKTLDVLSRTQGSEIPQSCKSSEGRNSAISPLFINTFSWNISHKPSGVTAGGDPAEVGNSTCTLASTVQAGQARLSPSHSEGLEETLLLSSERDSSEQFKEGSDESPRTSAPETPVTPDTSASHGSITKLPQEKPTAAAATTECLQVTSETEDTSTITAASKAHAVKHRAASVAENDQEDEEHSPQTPDENIPRLPSDIQLGYVLSGAEERLCMVPRVPGIDSHVPQLPEEEGLCGDFSLQIDNQSADKSLVTDRADKSLGQGSQEKGNETQQTGWQRSLCQHGSPSAADVQGRLPPTSAGQEDMSLVPSDHSPSNSREERGQNAGPRTSVSLVADATVQEDSQALSSIPSLSKSLLEESQETTAGNWEVGKKLKIITLEASSPELWPPGQQANSEYKGSEAGILAPNQAWAVSTILKAAASELEPFAKAPSAHGPHDESDLALADDKGMREGGGPDRSAPWYGFCSQPSSQSGFLESSVDPVDGKELYAAHSCWEASEVGGKETASQDQEENHLRAHHPVFSKRFLACPKLLESSVDPVDETGMMEHAWVEKAEPSGSTLGLSREGGTSAAGNLGRSVEVHPAILQVPCPQGSGEAILSENRINRNQEDESGEAKLSQPDEACVDVRSAAWHAPCPDGSGERIPGGHGISRTQEGSDRSSGVATPCKEDQAELGSPSSPLPSCHAVLVHASVGVDRHSNTGQTPDIPAKAMVEPRNDQFVLSDPQERGTSDNERGKRSSTFSDLTRPPFTSYPAGNIAGFPVSHPIEEPKTEASQTEETKPPGPSGMPAMTLTSVSGEYESEKAPKLLQDPGQKGFTLGCVKKSREKKSCHMAAQTGKSPGAMPGVTGSEEAKRKQETSGSGHLAEGVKKKILSKVAALRLRLEEKENVKKNSVFLKKIPKLETSLSHTDEKKDPKKSPCKREGKAPILLKKIHAEMFPDHSGNVNLSCQFAEIHEDSTIWWTKDSKSIAQVHRRAGDNSAVSLAIVQAGQKDQGLYYCCIKNSYGKVTAEFNLTAEVLKQLSSHQDIKGCEEIEFSQLIFQEDFLSDSYFGGHLRGQIATEELHFGEGVHRKAFRSRVMQGLTPVFKPGHACVLKVHNAIAYGTRNNDELVQRNYKLAAQECYVQNTARHYAKIYAAEAQPLEGFGEVPEIIPIFLIHRPENNIPYATVEEELIGEFVKYSIRDGKEINFLRRDSEAGQKCCTFQHWVYQKTSGCLLVTDMQGVGMKLTDVGIATLAKGYKGFKGNCSMTFIDQFKALHQCNKYCKMLGLKSLQNNNQKQKKPGLGKSRFQTNSTTAKNTESGTPAEKKS
ncbi:alpha-protein kinase 2 [Tupaia chinensis]|uniref:alpha-protein kinase 2 n=1 Tax=Tupaia chinensis TaxID=246437 RepID=UPI0003C8CA78|nr:alpha-protein kinase 2 [Tupaia chinensis]